MSISWIKYTLAQKYPPRSPLWRGALAEALLWVAVCAGIPWVLVEVLR